ncbi:MAG: VanZ family protein [Firmicutes bacterium]|nr:VanZ family protein [Bacillota bacterium]
MTISPVRRLRICRAVFALYLLVLFYVVLLMHGRSETFGDYNLIPGKSIRMFCEYFFRYHEFSFRYWFLNLFGNLLIFVPLGMLLPHLREGSGWRSVLVFSFLLSISIEALQYFSRLGEADVDDVLLNVAGAMLGCALNHLITRLLAHRSAKTKLS